MRKYILLSMVSHEKMTLEPYGRKILELLYNKYPDLAPEYCNYHEPVNIPISSVEEALKIWNEEWFFCRRKHSVQMSGSVTIGKYKISSIVLEYNWHKNKDWFLLFKELICISKSYFGYVHVFTEHEIEGAAIGSAVNCFTGGTPGWALKKNGIPQLGWGHYFGGEYVKELDLPLLKQHGFEVTPLGEGYVFTITDSIEDVITNYNQFNTRRQELKSLFRHDLFQNYARYEYQSKLTSVLSSKGSST